MVVPCGTAAPVLFQWFVSRDVPTGAPFSNGTLIPILIPSFLLLVYLHSRKFIRSMDRVKSYVLVRASCTMELPDIIKLVAYYKFKRLPVCLQGLIYALIYLFLSRLALGLGYLFMDELTKAVAPFLPSSGGMPGGSSTPPGPLVDTYLPPMDAENESLPDTSSRQHAKDSYLRERIVVFAKEIHA